jgi:hypothetical protein
MNKLSPLPVLATGRYRHYKGGEYEVLGVVRHSESLEPLVLYRPLYNASGMWVRPYAMFTECVTHNGCSRPRFMLLADTPPDTESVEVAVGGEGSAPRQKPLP